MNTTEQTGSRESTSGSGARAELADVVLLLVTILILMGIAAGIAIGFPLALELVATQASAAAIVSPAPQERPPHQQREYSAHRIGRSAPPLDARHRVQEEEKIELEDEPVIIDDVRSGKLMYAETPNAASLDRSTPQPSTNNR